ncbi:MAG: DUF4197 family protein [Bacteroidales bacterium]
MKTRIIPILLSLLLFITEGCDELRQISQQADSGRPLTRQKVIQGLRHALVIGGDSAAAQLSAIDGYYGDEMVRIMLPLPHVAFSRSLKNSLLNSLCVSLKYPIVSNRVSQSTGSGSVSFSSVTVISRNWSTPEKSGESVSNARVQQGDMKRNPRIVMLQDGLNMQVA